MGETKRSKCTSCCWVLTATRAHTTFCPCFSQMEELDRRWSPLMIDDLDTGDSQSSGRPTGYAGDYPDHSVVSGVGVVLGNLALKLLRDNVSIISLILDVAVDTKQNRERNTRFCSQPLFIALHTPPRYSSSVHQYPQSTDAACSSRSAADTSARSRRCLRVCVSAMQARRRHGLST